MIAVVGSTGYVGSRLAARLRSDGVAHRGLARRPVQAGDVAADLTRPESLVRALEGCSVAVHCAAVTADRRERHRGEYREVNVDGTQNLVEAAGHAGVQRIVLLNGLGAQPGRPDSYMRTRWEMLEAVRGGGLRWVSLQPSILFGAGAAFQTAIARLVRIAPVLPILGDGRTCVQPIWVDNLVTCLSQAARDARWDGAAIDLGGPERMTMREFSVLIAKAAGRGRLPVSIPLPLARLQAGLLTMAPPTPATLELFDFPNCTTEDSVEKTFGFKPQSLREHFAQHGLN